jgi:hypothetical protein
MPLKHLVQVSLTLVRNSAPVSRSPARDATVILFRVLHWCHRRWQSKPAGVNGIGDANLTSVNDNAEANLTSVNNTGNVNNTAKFLLVNVSDRNYQVHNPIWFWTIRYQTYLILNLSDIKPIWYRIHLIPNLSDTKPLRYWTSQMPND